MLKAQLIGKLGKDATVNNVNGRNVINFSVAHSERFKDSQGNQQEKTVWVDCAYWTDRTAIAPYLIKGTQVFIEGSPESRSFTKSDGTPGVALSLRVRDIQLLGSKSDNANQQPKDNSNHPAVSGNATGFDDDNSLPF